MLLVATPGLAALIGFTFFCSILWCIAYDIARWRLGQSAHRAVDHDLLEMERVFSGEITIEEARFEVRQKDGTLVDDPDAVDVVRSEEFLRKHPPVVKRFE